MADSQPNLHIPTRVQTVVDAYLAAVAGAVPELIEGLYIAGSVALGDFRVHTSDIDFIAVTSNRPNAAALHALEQVHTRLHEQHPRPHFDGIYVTWDELACNPTDLPPGPAAHEGRFMHQEGFERNPITWHTLFQQGMRCCGPVLDDVMIWHDPSVLAAWTSSNLESYWRRLLVRGGRLFTPDGIVSLSAWACAWCVLGVTRLHYTLATGKITSKEGAGLYALDAFPASWRRVIEEALRIRRGDRRRSLYWSPLVRRRDVRAFMAMVIEDAHRVYAETAESLDPA